MQKERYRYRNLPIPGGGYVTGFVFHRKEPQVLYLRTDIGGVYRYEAERQVWKSLSDAVSMEDLRQTFPAAIAVAPQNASRLYVMSGIYKNPHGLLSISDDRGEHFRNVELPFMVHGNLNGRGTGYRLAVDEEQEGRLYYSSQENGLWRSVDDGITWEKIKGMQEDYLTFVCCMKGGRILVGSAGVTTKRTEHLRGRGLYISYDNGGHFEPLWQPEDGEVPGIRLAGLVPQRYALDGDYFYVTFSVMGYNAYVVENGYSCDGGSVVGGKVVRYPLPADGRIGQGEEITPKTAEQRKDAMVSEKLDLEKYLDANGILSFGFGGIDTSLSEPGLLVVSSICKEDGDCIFRSFDYGKTWECILHGLDVGRMNFRTSYMKPQYNGGGNLIHWLTDLKIDPFDKDTLWFNTGTGVFRTKNLTQNVVAFEDWSDGIEETVHLNLYSPAGGDVLLLDILGDLGGFAFTSLDKPCDNSFADENGNRYITCLNADCSDLHPEYVLVTPRGNWTGKTKGGLIFSEDGGRTFRRISMPFGLHDKVDRLLQAIERPNVNSGWAALSPSGKGMVWSVCDGIELPADAVLVSRDGGDSFVRAALYDRDGQELFKKAGADDDLHGDAGMQPEKAERKHLKVFSDRVNDSLFYGFGEKGQFYVSRDGGLHFYEQKLSCPLPVMDLGLVDCANKTEIRAEAGRQGVIYLALGEEGLWKLTYDDKSRQTVCRKLSGEGDAIFRIGLGVGFPGADYSKDDKALYLAARIAGRYGFYRYQEKQQSYMQLNDNDQMYGEINSVEGDSRAYGRFYIGTGSRGVLYGEPQEQEEV